MIVFPLVQFKLCQSQIEFDSVGVGFSHCFYNVGVAEVPMLMLGIILVLAIRLLRLFRRSSD